MTGLHPISDNIIREIIGDDFDVEPEIITGVQTISRTEAYANKGESVYDYFSLLLIVVLVNGVGLYKYSYVYTTDKPHEVSVDSFKMKKWGPIPANEVQRFMINFHQLYG